MNTTAPRIVLDTNVLIASIGRTSPFRWLFDGVINGNLKLCVSNEILLEYREILARKTNPTIAENLSAFLMLSPNVEQTIIFYSFRLITEDETDNKFVDCAIASQADYLVSNDGHFRVLATLPFPRVRVLTLTQFEAEFRLLNG